MYLVSFYMLLLWSFPVKGSPPAALIMGTVYDSETRDPLPGASILFEKDQGTITDINGHYHILLDIGKTTLRFHFLGYKTQSHILSLQAGDTLYLDVGLTPDITQMDQVVVSAAKAEQRVSKSTVSVSIIKPESLAAAHISNPRELMNRTSGIEVLDGQASIRGGSGFSYGAGSRVLALIDGLPALAADAGSIRWNFLPLENISQVEVIKGASSVLYGSSALNGIINFRLADPTPQAHTSIFAESGIFDQPRREAWVWWDQPRLFSSASFSHRKIYGKTGVAFGSFFSTDNGYRRLNDEHLARVNLRLTRQPDSLENLNYGITLHAGYNKKRDFLLWEDAWQGALKQSPETENLLEGTFFAFDPFISYDTRNDSRHDLRLRLQATDNHYPEQLQHNSQAQSLYAEYQVQTRLSNIFNINAGLVQQLSRVESNLYGNHKGWNAAAYTQADMNLTEELSLLAGVRLEHNTLNGQADRLVPLLRAGANYRLANLTFIRASFGQGYRFPSIAEKHAATTTGAVRIFPNPEVLAESGWGLEAGIKQGLISPSVDAMFDFSLFYTQNSDLIEYVFGIYPIAGSSDFDFGFRAANIEHSRVYGMELEFTISNQMGPLANNLSGGYVFMNPVEFNPRTMENTGEYLKFRRKHAGSLKLSTAWLRVDLHLNLQARSRILDIDDVFLNELTRERILPGFFEYWQQNNTPYWVADLNLGYQITGTYRISFGIKNLFNAEYMGRPGDIQPHRHFSLRFTGTW